MDTKKKPGSRLPYPHTRCLLFPKMHPVSAMHNTCVRDLSSGVRVSVHSILALLNLHLVPFLQSTALSRSVLKVAPMKTSIITKPSCTVAPDRK